MKARGKIKIEVNVRNSEKLSQQVILKVNDYYKFHSRVQVLFLRFTMGN